MRTYVFAMALVFSFFAVPTVHALEETTQEQLVAGDEVVPLTDLERTLLSQFREPQLEHATKQKILENYTALDPMGLIPPSLLETALLYYHENSHLLERHDYLTIVNLRAPSSQKRMFILNMNTGVVWPLHVAHGAGSDRDNDGLATEFSNTVNSNMSSLGFYRTAEAYRGAHGRSLRMDGLSESNSKVRERAIVIHGADYVKDRERKQGRSWGCFAVSRKARDQVVSILQEGTIIYAGLAD